jgi:hypothetical protein
MEGKINIWPIIKKAIKITWKNKLLWLLGIFAFIISPLGEIESILTGGSNISQPGFLTKLVTIIINSKLLTVTGLRELAISLVKQPAFTLSVLTFGILALIIFIAIILLSVICQGALIYQAALLNKGQKSRLKLALKAGLKKFWPILVIDLIFKATFAFLFFTIGLFISKNFLFLLILFITFSIIIIYASFITKLSIRGVVLENLPISIAFKQGIQLFTAHWFKALKLMICLLIVSAILETLLVIAISIIKILISATISTAALFGSASGFLLSVNLLLIIMIALRILMLAIFTTIHLSAWTILFTELKKVNPKSV